MARAEQFAHEIRFLPIDELQEMQRGLSADAAASPSDKFRAECQVNLDLIGSELTRRAELAEKNA